MKNSSALRRASARPLAASIASLLVAAGAACAQTSTLPTGGTFTNPLLWNSGAGPVPASDPALALTMQNFVGITTYANDLNLTLNTLHLAAFGSGSLALTGMLGGDYAFTGGAGVINLTGSAFSTLLSAPVVFGQGLTSLTFDGAGASGVEVSGVISSNMGAGAPLVVSTDAGNPGRSEVTLSGANTFSGGVMLNTGTLALNDARALGARTNTLTINGGNLRGTNANIDNDITLNATLNVIGFGIFSLRGALSGAGGVTGSASITAGGGLGLGLGGINTFTGAVTVRGQDYAAMAFDGGGAVSITGAAGSVLNTAGIDVSEGGAFRLNYGAGNSVVNSRVSIGSTVSVTSGFLETIGNAGIVRQTIGSVNAGGLTTILANTTGATTSGTEITINNFVRAVGGTVTFSGLNLGGATVAPGLAAAQGNILLGQINGSSPFTSLTGGGGGANTTTISILPWALGETSNTAQSYFAGSGFVTYDFSNGVRLLNPATEYNTTNNFATAGGTDNMRITGAVTNPAFPIGVNSIFFATTGQTIGGANTINIATGAVASNVAAATISAPVNFGNEGIVSVIGDLNTTNLLTLSGNVNANSFVKSGHGRLALSGAANAIPGDFTINGGQVLVSAISQLGGAGVLTFNGHSYAASRAELRYEVAGAGADTLTAPVITNGGMAGFYVATADTLTVSSGITGAGGVRKDGPGTLVLTGFNNYRGGTYLGGGVDGGGTLEIDSDARLGDATDPAASFLGLANGGTLRLSGNWISARAISVDGTATLHNQASNATLSGPITGTGTIFKFGSGALTITGGDNGYSGVINIGPSALGPGGTVALSGAGALNSARISFGGGTSPAGTYLFDLSGATAPSGRPWRSLASLNTPAIFTRPHKVRLGLSQPASVDLHVAAGSFGGTAGFISGFGNLVKVGTGALTLNGSALSTFTGGVEIWGGTLVFGANGQLGDLLNGIKIQGGILNNTASFTMSRAITLGATPQPLISAATVQPLINGINANTGTTLTLNGPIVNVPLGGAGGFNKSGLGTVTLGALNNYRGDTQVSAGTLSVADNASLGATESRLRMNGGTLQFNSGLPAALPRTILLTANSTLSTGTLPGGTLDVSGPIVSGQTVGANTLFRTGTNAMTISGNSPSFFGTLSIGNGTGASGSVTLAATGQLRRATVTLAANSGATFDMSGLTREFGGLTLAAGTTLNLGFGGRVTAGFNNGSLALDGSIVSAGGASFTKVGIGSLTISGAITVPSGFHLLSAVGGTISGNGSLAFVNGLTVGGWGNSGNSGTSLNLSNVAIDVASRLDDAQIIDSNSGSIQFDSNAGVASTEFVRALRGAGMTNVGMATGGTLHFTDGASALSRVNNGAFNFGGGNGNLGSGPATTTVPNIIFANALTLGQIGGNGSPGSTTISIVPYAIGGGNLVTHGAFGMRPLDFLSEYNTSLLSALPAENVRLSPATLVTTTLTADHTVNALVVAAFSTTGKTRLESAGGQRLILESGTLLGTQNNVFTVNAAGTAGVLLGIQTAELQTGAGNSRELNVFTGGELAIGALVTTSGGLTTSGGGALYLTNPGNTYTGATTVNAGSLVIDNLAALGGSALLQLGGGFLKYRGGDALLSQPVIASGFGSIGGSAGFHVVSGTTLTTSLVSGFGGVLKDGTGVLRLPAGTQTGATLIAAGALAISDPAALGTNTRVVFTDSTISPAGGQTLRFDAPMTLGQDFITNSAFDGIGFGFDTNGHDVTLNGTILGAALSSAPTRGLYKFGAGELNLTAMEMYTGATQIFGGTLRLSGENGSIVNSSGTGGFTATATVSVNSGTALVLDNSPFNNNNNNRLPDVWDTPFGTGNGASGKLRVNGGEFKILGNPDTGTSERINQFDITAGTITLDGGGGVVLTSGRFARVFANSIGLIRGTNLGGTPGFGSTNWFVTDLSSGSVPLGSVQLGGAGGAEGTPFVNILPGFMGDTNAAGIGTDFLTYAADTGFRLLTAGEYAVAIPAGNFDLNRAPNVALTGPAVVNETTAITALKLAAGVNVFGNGTLVLAQSTVLATGNATINVASLSTHISGGNPGYDFLTPGTSTTLTVGAMLPGAGLWKYGEGTLRLDGPYTGGGFVDVAQGTLTLGFNGALNPAQTVFVHRHATLDLGGSDRVIGSLTRTIAISAFNMGQINDGTVALGPNRLTLYDGTDSTFTGGITGAGGLTKAFASVGVSTFTQPLSYGGSTVLRGGTLRLAGAGTLNTGGVDIRGGALEFNNTDDNAAAGGYLANRIGSLAAIELAGGSVIFTENDHTPGNHTLGIVRVTGGGVLTITNGSTAPSTVTIGDLIRPSRGTLTVNATNLGLAQSPVGNARVLPTLISGGAPIAALIGGILPWASDASGNFLTHGAHGLRPLAASEYDPAFVNPNANVRTTAPQALFAPTTANALLITGGDVTGSHDLTLTSGGLAATASVNIGASTHTLRTGAGDTRELIVHNTAGTTVLDYRVSTSGGVTKSGAGALTLNGANTFTGGLNINQGFVNFSKDNNLGAPGETVRFGGGSSTLAAQLHYTGTTRLTFTRPVETSAMGYFTSGAANVRWKINGGISGPGGIGYSNSVPGAAVFTINSANSYTGPTQWISGHLRINGDSAFGSGGELIMKTDGTPNIVLRGLWTTDRLIDIATHGAIQTNNQGAEWSGQLVGSGSLTKNGEGNLTLTEAMPWTGALTVNAGGVQLYRRGSIAANGGDHRINAGAFLVLDNTILHFSDRLHDSTGGVTLTGGDLLLYGNAGPATEEVIHNLTLSAASASSVTVGTNGPSSAILRIAGALTVDAGASLFRGNALGLNMPGTASSANILINTGTAPLTGGAAPAGHPSISIIRGAFGDTNAGGRGTQLVTYDFDKGIRLLDPNTEYTTTLQNGSAVTDNVKADGSVLPLPNATTANALWLSNGGSVSGGGPLTLTAGNLLVTGSGNNVFNPISAGANAFAIGGLGDVALHGGVSGTGGLIKQGDGTLTLTAASTYTGTTVLAGGTVALGNAGAFSNSAVQIQVGNIRNATGGLLTLANNLTLNGPLLVTGTQNLTFTGSVVINHAMRHVVVFDPSVTVRLNGPVSASQSLIDYGLTKTGPGTLILNGPQNYDVLTTIDGITNLNQPLGTGDSIINANARTNIGASQNLDELNLGPGAVVTLGAPIPAPLFDDPALDALTAGSPQAVPEPTAITLLCCAASLLSFRFRTRMSRGPASGGESDTEEVCAQGRARVIPLPPSSTRRRTWRAHRHF